MTENRSCKIVIQQHQNGPIFSRKTATTNLIWNGRYQVDKLQLFTDKIDIVVFLITYSLRSIIISMVENSKLLSVITYFRR